MSWLRIFKDANDLAACRGIYVNNGSSSLKHGMILGNRSSLLAKTHTPHRSATPLKGRARAPSRNAGQGTETGWRSRREPSQIVHTDTATIFPRHSCETNQLHTQTNGKLAFAPEMVSHRSTDCSADDKYATLLPVKRRLNKARENRGRANHAKHHNGQAVNIREGDIVA